MKKLLVISTLIVSALLSCAGFLVYKHALADHRSVFRACISAVKESRLKKITIHPNELFVDSKRLHWEDDNKEIMFEHTLYDVVKIESEGAGLVLLVLADDEEEELKKQFSGDNKTHDPGPYLKVLKQYLDLKYTAFDEFEFRCFEKNADLFTELTFFIYPVFIDTGILPPDQAA